LSKKTRAFLRWLTRRNRAESHALCRRSWRRLPAGGNLDYHVKITTEIAVPIWPFDPLGRSWGRRAWWLSPASSGTSPTGVTIVAMQATGVHAPRYKSGKKLCQLSTMARAHHGGLQLVRMEGKGHECDPLLLLRLNRPSVGRGHGHHDQVVTVPIGLPPGVPPRCPCGLIPSNFRRAFRFTSIAWNNKPLSLRTATRLPSRIAVISSTLVPVQADATDPIDPVLPHP
jgi:hypothetical protein